LAGSRLPASQSAYLRLVSLITLRLKIGFRPVRQEHARRGLEVGAGLVEGGGGAALVLARMRARIEAAPPFPRIGVVRVAGADRDRADADVAKADLPAFVAGFEMRRRVRTGMALKCGQGGRATEKEKWPQREGTR
jgi:hypothetical protein